MIQTATTADAVQLSVDVEVSIAHAFQTFTQRMEAWWDPTHHLLPDTIEMRVEPHAGGTITDVARDGRTCTWGRILTYEPPTRFRFTWDITLEWQVEPDPARCSEVDVLFTSLSEDRTRVELTHRELHRHGDGWEAMAAAVGGPNGWILGLGRFVAVCAS